MLKIRFQRRGTRKKPYYRLVVMPSTSAMSSKVIENLGSYNPLEIENQFQADADRVKYWLEKGAQASRTASVFLRKKQIIEDAPKI